MKIFVTGANGFIGQEFCRAALANGHEVLGLQRNTNTPLPTGCQSALGSLENVPWAAIDSFTPDTALHLAWIATPGAYLDSPENERLVAQSAALFQGLLSRGVNHVAGTGTCIEYAASVDPLFENTSPLDPASPYSRAKIETYQRLKALSEEAGTGWSWLRLFYPYGAGEHPKRMPSSLMKKLVAGESVEIKTPDSIKDYIYVSDAAEAILAVMETRMNGPVNIGTGTGVRIMDLAGTIAEIFGLDANRIKPSDTPATDPFPVTVADTKKLLSTGWSPKIRLTDGLVRLKNSLG